MTRPATNSTMRPRVAQSLLIATTLWLCWLAMMLVHESGHMLGALCSGGTVRRMVWYPTVISRTDVQPNPHPLIEVWAGPMIGSFVPLAAALFCSILRLRIAYLFWAFAGFCLIANGAYIGIGAIKPIGDGQELIDDGMSRWALAAFGLVAVPAGMWIWDRVSPRFGFGAVPRPVDVRHACGVFVAAVVLTAMGFAVGHRGF